MCRVRAHMALCYANVDAWTKSSVAVFAANMAFVNMWHGMGRDEGEHAGSLESRHGIGFPDMDVCQLVSRTRHALVQWTLAAHEHDLVFVLQHCERVVTGKPDAEWGGSELAAQVAELTIMGYTKQKAVFALSLAHGNVQRAANLLITGQVSDASMAAAQDDQRARALSLGCFADPSGRFEFLFQTLELTTTTGGGLIPVPDKFARHALFKAYFGDKAPGLHCTVSFQRAQCTALQVIGTDVTVSLWKELRSALFVVDDELFREARKYVLGVLCHRHALPLCRPYTVPHLTRSRALATVVSKARCCSASVRRRIPKRVSDTSW